MKLNLTRKKILIWSGSLFFGLIILCAIMHYFDRHPSTDDAYVQAGTIHVAAQVTGPVASILVKDHQAVQKGQLLFTIDPLSFQIAVDKAQANVAAKQATLLLAEQNAERILRLVRMEQASKAAGDQIQSQLDSAKADLVAGQAQLAQAKLDLDHTKIMAPAAGVVTQFLLRPGNHVMADTTLFMIVIENDFWVDANFKETQIARIRAGQPVKIILDMFPHHAFYGVVDAISSASGSVFSLLPPENASGNWIKVTQRFPVKILFKEGVATHFPLRAGSTASVTIDATHV